MTEPGEGVRFPGAGCDRCHKRATASGGTLWRNDLRRLRGSVILCGSDPVWLRLAAGLCTQECAHEPGPPLQLLRICEHPFIIDIAAPSVAHYGPVEVLRLPVRASPTTRPLSLPTHEGERAHRRLSNAYPSTLYPVYSVRVVPVRPPSHDPVRSLAHHLTSSPREVTHDI